MTDDPIIDPSLLRGLTQSRFTRRDLFRYAGVAGGALGLSAFLAACGTKGVATGSGGAGKPNANMGDAAWWGQQTLHKTLDFDNWPYYMDIGPNNSHPSLDEFTKKTGIKVNYTENIQDNPSYWNQHIFPQLSHGQSQGHDIIVLTNNDYPLGYMLNFGWAIPLDHGSMPNFDKYASKLVTNPSYDPGNTYTMAWQSGYTLIAYNTKYIKDEITTVDVLWDPKYKGKIGMFGNASELGCLGLLAIGKDPATSTPADWTAAAAKLQEQKPLVRSYYDQDYIKALKSEDTWISMAWSGDIFQAGIQGYDTLKTAVPQEGVMFWTDNMLMPYTASNPKDAMTYMDYVYDPKVQAVIEDYNNYVCPVPSSKGIIGTELHDPAVANSPLVFPNAAMVAAAKPYYQWKNTQDLKTWNDTFQPIYLG
ncbi:MAG TPA: spermidine/putrescine ABC transporter substrate-binding protein [Actinomycetota bacterium]|nr:spermidine/putrescine ABC transporter substrate-binding protein [Actinomycetota bacterium]